MLHYIYYKYRAKLIRCQKKSKAHPLDFWKVKHLCLTRLTGGFWDPAIQLSHFIKQETKSQNFRGYLFS